MKRSLISEALEPHLHALPSDRRRYHEANTYNPQIGLIKHQQDLPYRSSMYLADTYFLTAVLSLEHHSAKYPDQRDNNRQ